MKKMWALAVGLVVLLAIFHFMPPDEKSSRTEAVEPAEQDVAPETLKPAEDRRSSSAASAGEIPWLNFALNHRLNPENIEALAQTQGVPLKRETKGHPRSGQRLELSWGQDPATTAVFDIVEPNQYQLNAVRTLYPPDTNYEGIKSLLQGSVQRPIEREDAQSLVFTPDEQGLVVWLQRQDDGTLKLALEYGAHSHEAAY